MVTRYRVGLSLLPAGLVFLLLGCSGQPHFADDYAKGLRRYSDLPSRMRFDARAIGKSGKTEIRERDFFYAGVDGEVTQPSDLTGLDAGLRDLIIRKELLRRLAIADGIQEGIYSSPEALAFILPRLEKILEDYYYHKHGNLELLTAKAEKLAPDDESLAALLRSDPALARVGAEMKDLRRQRAVLIKRMVERRAEEERQALIGEILKRHPTLEVLP